MLKFFRKKYKIIIWAVVASFILWGGFSVGTSFQKKGRIAGQVYGKNIAFQEYNMYYDITRFFLSTEEQRNNPDALKQQAWINLIYGKEAERQKIKVSDDEVRGQINQLFAQQNLPRPTKAMYENWLKRTVRIPAHQFEKQLRELLRIQKLKASIVNAPSEPVTQEEVYQAFLLDNQKLAAEAVSFDAADRATLFASKVHDEADWKREIEKNNYVVEPVLKMTLTQFLQTWQIPPGKVLELFELPAGVISAPLPTKNKFTVFRLLEKEPVEDSQFDEETEKKYLEVLTQQQKYRRFLMWHMELIQRANPQDYLKESKS